jgi:O-antigen/teichoic acid export membrane protein
MSFKDKSSNKAFFNVIIQIIPITVALITIPLAINNLGKPLWYLFTLGLTVILLPNYFSFGIGPFLTRDLSTKDDFMQSSSWLGSISLIKVMGLLFFILTNFYFYFSELEKPFLIKSDQFYFFFFFNFSSIVYFFLIPLRSIFESKQDFYFLGTIRAVFTSLLMLIPVFSYNSIWFCSFIILILSLFQFFVYLLRLKYYHNQNIKGLFIGFSKIEMKKTILKTWPFGGYLFVWSILLYSDRFILKSHTDIEILSDHVTMQDLFNRLAIISGNLTAVFYPFISKNKDNPLFIDKYYKKQIFLISISFISLLFILMFALKPFLTFWLKNKYSFYIDDFSFLYLIGIMIFNFSIIQVRTLQAIGFEVFVLKILILTSIFYLISVFIVGYFNKPYLFSIILIIQSLIVIIKLHKKYVKEKNIHTI